MNIFDKIFIHEAIEFLDIPKKPIDHVIHSLMNDKKLTTYFDLNVPATTFAGIDMRPINQEGDELPYVDGAPPTSHQTHVGATVRSNPRRAGACRDRGDLCQSQSQRLQCDPYRSPPRWH